VDNRWFHYHWFCAVKAGGPVRGRKIAVSHGCLVALPNAFRAYLRFLLLRVHAASPADTACRITFKQQCWLNGFFALLALSDAIGCLGSSMYVLRRRLVISSARFCWFW
jgi:hypothetical protein